MANSISIYNVKNAIRQEKTGEEIAKFLGYSSKWDFYDELKKSHRQIAPRLIDSLERNEKLKNKEKSYDSPEVKELKEKETVLASKQQELEKKHEECLKKKEEILKEVENLSKELDRIKKAVTANTEKYAALTEELKQVEAAIANGTTELKELREEIKKKEKLVIILHKDGSLVSNKEMSVAEETVESVFYMLLKMEEAEDYTLKELRTLSKLYVLKKNLNEHVEIRIEENPVRVFFEKITKIIA